MKINGHLQDFSLQDLLKILTNLRESGCLTIDFQPEPGVFYFSRGQLVEGRLSDKEGQDAIKLALSLPKATFQFDDDVEIPKSETVIPAQPSAEPHPEGLRLSIETAEPVARTHTTVPSLDIAPDVLTTAQLDSSLDEGNGVPAGAEQVPGPGDIQFIYPQQGFSYIKRQRIITAAVAILLIGVPAAVGVTVHLRTRSETAATIAEDSDSQSNSASPKSEDDKSAAAQAAEPTTPEPSRSPDPTKDDPIAKESADADTPKIISEATDDARKSGRPDEAADAHVKRPPPEAKAILVMVQITDGRVTEAWVKDPHTGSEAVEAAAVRMARQRHYPPNVTRTETLAISVTVNH